MVRTAARRIAAAKHRIESPRPAASIPSNRCRRSESGAELVPPRPNWQRSTARHAPGPYLPARVKPVLFAHIKRGEFDVLRNLDRLGELLIAVRIYLGLTQAELAERLGVDPSVVCRDERNEYHGVTLERAVKILNVMGVELRTSVEVPGCGPAMPSCETPGGHRPSAARTGPALAGRTG